MQFWNRTSMIGALLFSLSALIACSAPGAVDPTSPPVAQEPSPTVAAETPENTVTPAPTETAPAGTAPAPTPTATATETENPLLGTAWTLVSFGPAGEETPVLADSDVTLQFDDAGHGGGSAGCNSYGGDYEIENDSITFSPIVSTMMACADEDVMDQEQRYLTALQAASRYELQDDGQQLMIWYDEGEGVLNFAQGASPPDSDDSADGSEQLQIGRLALFDDGAGWATGRPGEAATDQVFVTTDGGESWQNVTPEEPQSDTLQPTFDLTAAAYFASPQQAWVAFSQPQPAAESEAPQVWLTADGGQSWQPSAALDLEEIPFDYFGPSDLDSLDGQFGWLMAHLGAGMSHDYIAIFTTQDGGESWQRVTDPDNNPDIQACNKSGLLFTSSEEGWLAGNCPGLMQPLFLYRTSDGGATWAQTELPAPEGLEEGNLGDNCGVPQIAPLSGAGLSLALRCFDFEEESSQAWLYTTEDGGANWQAQPLPEAAGVFTFLDGQEGWYLAADESQLDEDSRLYHTTDGGATWQSLAQIAGQGLAQIQFADASTGWAITGYPPERTLFRTTDGGATWQELQPVVIPATQP